MKKSKKAWVVTVDMGYGHQRAAYPFKDIAYERIITANSDKIVNKKEKKQWKRFQFLYEFISRFRSIPLIGDPVWRFFDNLQAISPFYPYRDLSKPNLGSIYLNRLVKKKFMKSVIDHVKEKKLPFVSTFFVPAISAAHSGIKDVYCIVTDTDINRAWVPKDPKKDKIYYLAPTEISQRRLSAYGVPKKNIFFTGFPLPFENTGENLSVLKKDLGRRLPNLDPDNIYINRYKDTIKKVLGRNLKKKSDHPLTITYAIGGAGAQKEIGGEIIKSLSKKIRKDKVKLILSAGTRLDVNEYLESEIRKNKLERSKNVKVIFSLSKKDYFEEFNESLHHTDILWTKPSELCFYTALGLPIIISPALGSHEKINRKWLLMMGTGFMQEDPRYTDEWLFDWIKRGILAESAWEGFTEAPRFGTENIKKIIFAKDKSKVKLRY